jgi:hypothetical protein
MNKSRHLTMVPMLVTLGETMPVSTLKLTGWHQWGITP